jgi:thiol:disulfide interchange protein DsbD
MLRHAFILLTVFIFNTPTFAADSLDQLVRNAAALKLNLFGDELLRPEQAFEFSANVKNDNTLYVSWEIAPNYYLYREKIKLELIDSNGVKLGDFTIPKGSPKHDESFGNVEIFSGDLNFNVPLNRENKAAQTVTLRASFQGCATRGVCYPPMKKDVVLELPISK